MARATTTARTTTGWILDVDPHPRGALAWVRDDEGGTRRLVVPFNPAFYLVPRDASAARLALALEEHPSVRIARVTRRKVHVGDLLATPVVEVRVASPLHFRRVVDDARRLEVARAFNVDVPLAQAFFYERELFPFARCEFELAGGATPGRRGEGDDAAALATGVTPLESNEALHYAFPPLRACWLRVTPRSGRTRPRWDEPLGRVELVALPPDFGNSRPPRPSRPGRRWVVQERDEATTLLEAVAAVRRLDPDVLLTRDGDGTWFPYLEARASALGLSDRLDFSRDPRPLRRCRLDLAGDDHYFSYGAAVRQSPTQYYLRGRLHVDVTTHGGLHFSDGNVPGLVEVARVARVPLQRLCRVTIGGALQSLQFYHAHRTGLLVPPVKLNLESFKPATTLLLADKGGFIYDPRPGLFFDVVELDFDSMYPTLMRVYNVSPETVNCACCAGDPARNVVPEVGFHTCVRREGIVPAALRVPLAKRLAYKRLAARGGPKARWYGWLQAALKWILVVSFGYLGFRNARYGRVEAHQAVCAYSRELLLRAAEVARRNGFEVVHGIVDSLWLRSRAAGKPGERDGDEGDALEERVRRTCAQVHEATRLSIGYEGRYKFIVFMPSRASPRVPTLTHYWGVKTDGSVKVRGLELRRRDSPPLVKRAQRQLIELFANANDRRQFLALLPEADAIVEEYERRLREGDVDPEDLAVTARLSRSPGRYLVNSHAALAAKQLRRKGASVGPGTKVRYVVVDSRAASPAARVVLAEDFGRAGKPGRFDAEKYAELVRRAYQNLLPFDLKRAKVRSLAAFGSGRGRARKRGCTKKLKMEEATRAF
ncbi:MAG: hypothetical protein Kow0069_29370 [Promethearchaeota archaeon]